MDHVQAQRAFEVGTVDARSRSVYHPNAKVGHIPWGITLRGMTVIASVEDRAGKVVFGYED